MSKRETESIQLVEEPFDMTRLSEIVRWQFGEIIASEKGRTIRAGCR
ncbi:MAG: hypothetical protein ACLVIY_09935 [Anaerobutyricum soehngenii]